jgi:hypothetical protein
MVRITGAREGGTRANDGGAGGRVQSRGDSQPPAADAESLGNLVALAAKDISQLIRYEMDLAKSELRADVKRAALSGALFGFAAFIGCLVLVLLTFALAYGLKAAGVPGGGGLYVNFVYAAVILVIVAAVLVAAAVFGLRKFSGMRQTRKTVTADLSMLRRRDAGGAPVGVAGTPATGGDAVAAVAEGRS